MSSPQSNKQKHKTVECDYCGEEKPKYSWGQDGLRREYAPKLPNGLRRCADCTAKRFIEEFKKKAITDDGIRRDKMIKT